MSISSLLRFLSNALARKWSKILYSLVRKLFSIVHRLSRKDHNVSRRIPSNAPTQREDTLQKPSDVIYPSLVPSSSSANNTSDNL